MSIGEDKTIEDCPRPLAATAGDELRQAKVEIKGVQREVKFHEAMIAEPHNLKEHIYNMASGKFYVQPPEHYRWGLGPDLDFLTLTYDAKDGEIHVLATPIFLFGVPENIWDLVLLFHYTNRDAFMNISERRSLKITRTGERPGDAKHGDAVYMTSKGPDEYETKYSVLVNNYSNRTDPESQFQNVEPHLKRRDADCCIPVLVPRGRAYDVSTKPDMREGRDVWVIPAVDDFTSFFVEDDAWVRQRVAHFKQDAMLKDILKATLKAMNEKYADTCEMTFLTHGLDLLKVLMVCVLRGGDKYRVFLKDILQVIEHRNLCLLITVTKGVDAENTHWFDKKEFKEVSVNKLDDKSAAKLFHHKISRKYSLIHGCP